MSTAKKFLFVAISAMIFMTFLVGAASIPVIPSVELSAEEEEKITSSIASFADEEGYTFENYSYLIKDVYLADETKVGYVIDFDFQGQHGYTIIFKLNNEIKTVEVFFGRRSPFYAKLGIYIYPSLGVYITKYNGQFYDLTNDENYSQLEMENQSMFYAAQNKDKSNVSQTITNSYKRAYRYSYDIPNFYYSYSTNLTKHSNNCANAAGLILINYWNRKFNNDILKLDAKYISSSGNIIDDARSQIMSTFYDYMGTNWFFGTGGTLPGDFHLGFRKLVTEKEYKVTRTVNPDYMQIRESLGRGIPVSITSTDYSYATSIPTVNSSNGNHNFTINYSRNSGLANAHTFIAYGYVFYSIYRDVEVSVWSPVWYNPFRHVTEIQEQNFQEQLLRVATGWGDSRYFNYSIGNLYEVSAVEVLK